MTILEGAAVFLLVIAANAISYFSGFANGVKALSEEIDERLKELKNTKENESGNSKQD